MSQGPSVLITGTSGYIGGALARDLSARGDRVTGTHRPGGPAAGGAGTERIVPLDLLGEQPLPDGALAGVDAVVHAAGVAHGKDPANLYTANADGSLALGRQAVRAGVRHLVFLSTIGVHGLEDDGTPITEATAIRPPNTYARAKRDAEDGLRALTQGTDTALTVLRPPMVYGPGAPGNLQTLLRWAARGLPFPAATRRNRRNLVGVDTLVRAIAAALETRPEGSRTYVVADPAEIATGEVFARLCREMGRTPRFLPVPTGPLRLALRAVGREATYQGLFANLRVDAGKLRRELDVAPGAGFDSSAPAIVRAFRENG